MTLPELVETARAQAYDLDLGHVKAWKARTGGKVLGALPVYVPREVPHALGMLPVSLFGGGDRLEIIRGDAYFQSYICHLPRSVIELLVSGRYDVIDAFLFPSTCDVIRNLSGMWQLLAPGKLVRYLDLPQNLSRDLGGSLYETDLRSLGRDLEALAGRPLTDDALRASIAAYNRNRALVEELHELRRRAPHLCPTSEVYVVLRAGAVVAVEEHSELLRAYIDLAKASGRPERDNARVVVVGSFCEQPPLGLIQTLERAGCDIVADDLCLGLKALRGALKETGDPFAALVDGYLEQGIASPIRYIGKDRKGRELIESVRRAHAEGVVFCAASFCDPALLDQPMMVQALAREGIPHASFKYSEDSGQFAVIREQAGTFADSIKLWSEVQG